MPGRTIIEWDKNDIEELGMLKIDILALGMLTCIRKALALINQGLEQPLELYTIPADDPKVYQMLCASDTIGVFQVESRAQMAMLPRLKPQCFYDLVIQVAIVRPGPIQGNMVHPFLRRRTGLEHVSFPDKRVESILGKTLGVPIFQEQAMRLAITLANFTPGEAEKLRRAMAAWKSHTGVIESFKEKITRGMKANGYTAEFAESCLNQIKGFSEYGFPESHAASFAHLVYASAWIKRHYPAEFACALLNSQPLGFYEPAQIIRDAQRHGVRVEPIDVNLSRWDCVVERTNERNLATLRLGLRMISGIKRAFVQELERSRASDQNLKSPRDIWLLTKGASRANLNSLARADAFSGADIGLSRAQAHWEIHELSNSPAPLDRYLPPRSTETKKFIKSATEQQEMFKDYASTGVSLRAHPIQYLREQLSARSVVTAESLQACYGVAVGKQVSVAGLTIIKQRPGTAKGVVFITLEDETNSVNLVIRPKLFELQHRVITLSAALLVTGKLERVGNLVYIDVNSVSSLDTALIASGNAS
jgi:error-prone DNA polymerase